MAIDFPSSPSNGDTYTYNGVTYVYNSTTDQWIVQGTGSSELYVLKTGDTMTGKLTGTTAEFSGNVETKDLRSADATVDTLTSNGLVTGAAGTFSGKLLVGTSSASGGSNVHIQDPLGSQIALQRGEAATAITDGEFLGGINFQDSGEKTYATIVARADGAAGSGDYPGRLVFSTTADGASSPTEHMRISSAGDVFLKPTNPDSISGSYSSFLGFRVTQTNNQSALLGVITAQGRNAWGGDLVFSTKTNNGTPNDSVTERLRIDSSGILTALGVYNNTTGTTNYVSVTSSGLLLRSTSSAKYKQNIETLEDSYSDALLNVRPVWYRSTSEFDNPAHSFWGFIAEEVAAIDPRLVNWKTVEVTYDENGSAVETPCDPEPEGVAYDRFVPHLLNLIKRQNARMEALEAEVQTLKGGTN